MADKGQPGPGETQVFSRKEDKIQQKFWDETSAMTMASQDRDARSMKVAWIGALVFHFLLFITVGYGIKSQTRKINDSWFRHEIQCFFDLDWS